MATNPNMKAQSVRRGWSGVAMGYPLVYIYIYTIQVLLKCTSNSSVAMNFYRWQTEAQQVGFFQRNKGVGMAQINGCA
jgi:hypothetical protein